MSAAGPPHVVAVGGGHGCARTLAALRILGVRTTAVVSVADDGGSSGRLRRDHGVVALGDLRAALLALAPTDATRTVLRDLVAHRFAGGDLGGHSLGNLVLLGPGSLFTSVLPNLLVPGVAAALAAGGARTVLVANLREQVGETEGMTLAAHVAALHAHVPGLRLDGVLLDPDSPLGATPPSDGPPVIAARLAGPRGISHEPALLAAAVADLLG